MFVIDTFNVVELPTKNTDDVAAVIVIMPEVLAKLPPKAGVAKPQIFQLFCVTDVVDIEN